MSMYGDDVMMYVIVYVGGLVYYVCVLKMWVVYDCGDAAKTTFESFETFAAMVFGVFGVVLFVFGNYW